jgi:predicted nucleic acid-binding protein
MAGVIVLDASLLIAHLDGADLHHDQATAILLSAATDAEDVAASPITLAEVLVGPARAGRLDQALAALRQLGVASVDLPTDAPAQLAELRAATGLKLPDCCVLLAATQTVAAVATFDAAVASAATRRGLALRTP